VSRFIYIAHLFAGALSALLLLSPKSTIAQSIGGVINTYTKVVAVDVCENELTVQSVSGFTPGDYVLIIQMKGAEVQLTNGPTFGTFISTAEAGQYEFAQIVSISGGAITLQNKLLRSYDASIAVQLVNVPTYANVTITSPLLPKQWDGVTGGVIAFKATGTVIMQADIDASGLGFRGGNASENGGTDSETDYYYTGISGKGGFKGEGITVAQTFYEAGRGALASGGGGGNARNSGGGGGSNGGVGGRGGDQLDQFTRLPIGGEGGHAFWTDGALFFGGAGGGGQQNDSEGSRGGNGGGIVIVRANAIEANGHAIRANGATAKDAFGDGAGGGGAGGTIVLDAVTITGSLVIEAKGGAGGNAEEKSAFSNCYGPGGGGGGGFIYTSNQTSFPLAAVMCTAGAAGTVKNTSGSCNGTQYGAEAGQVGRIGERNFLWKESPTPFIRPQVAPHIVSICDRDTVDLTASEGDSYLWASAPGLGDLTSPIQRVAPDKTTTYQISMKRNGCTYSDSVVVHVDPSPSSDFTGPLTICKDTKATYSIPQVAGEVYLWTVTGGIPTTGTGSSIEITWGSIGIGEVELRTSNTTCVSSTLKKVTVGDAITPTIVGRSTLCEGDTIVLTADAVYATYKWSTGETSPSIKVDKAGNYTLTVTTADGCDGSSIPFNIAVNAKPKVAINSSSTLLMDPQDSVILSATPGYRQYAWSTGANKDTIVVRQAGNYSVVITDSNGCTANASIDIGSFATQPRAELGLPIVEAAPGDHVIIPVNILSSTNLEASGATDFSYTITFNRSLLSPIDKDISSVSADRTRSVTKTGTRNPSLVVGAVSQIEFIAALGDTTECPLTFETMTWQNGQPVQTTVKHGTFKLLNICPEGGDRLFNLSGHLVLAPPNPNPASSHTIIRYELLEEGEVQLFLLDMLGREVLSIVHAHQTAGPYQVITDLSRLADGLYQCVLRTPSQIRTSRVEVSR
jgi:hypothetical protein